MKFTFDNLSETEKMLLADRLVRSGHPFICLDAEKKLYVLRIEGAELPVHPNTVEWFYNKLDYIPKTLSTIVNDKINIKYERIIRLAKAKIGVTHNLHDFDGYLTALVDAGVMHFNRRRKILDELYAELERIPEKFHVKH